MHKLALGTVQFGMNYGVANESGRVGLLEAKKILAEASNSQVNILDTAISYGISEEVLGKVGIKDFMLVSKLPSLPKSCQDIDSWVHEQVKGSLKRLGLPFLYGLLLHRSDDLLGHSGQKLIKAIQRVKADGLVQNVGLSIYNPSELDKLMSLMRIDIVQSPLSLVDRRLETSGWLSRLYQERVKIHTRSAFLQGLLLMPRGTIPSKFKRWGALLDDWHKKLIELDVSATTACLSYPLSLPEIERVVVGVDSSAQLKELISASHIQIPQHDFEFMSSDDQNFINPSKWSSL